MGLPHSALTIALFVLILVPLFVARFTTDVGMNLYLYGMSTLVGVLFLADVMHKINSDPLATPDPTPTRAA